MNKQDIYNYLQQKHLWHEITEHRAVFSMDELDEAGIPFPESDAKNLFVRDDKKQNYYLIVVKGNKHVNLTEFSKNSCTRRLSFASAADLKSLLDLTPGSVTPLGILNDTQCKVTIFLDRDFLAEPGLIGVHPNDNTATVLMKTADLIDIIEEHGNTLHIAPIVQKQTAAAL